MEASKLRIFFRMQHVAGVMKKKADKILLETVSITAAQAGVLAIIENSDTITQKDLAKALELNEAAITTMISRLGKLGYVERRRPPNDGRAWYLYITPEGRQVLVDIQEPFKRFNTAIEEAIGVDNLSDFSKKLDHLVDKFYQFK